ncbi:MAG: hypothetical protein MRQ12_04410 [Candidatus Midichloria mitochondrii]|nr:hypothetical protein [Candidatus Midichloria mitochondrii]
MRYIWVWRHKPRAREEVCQEIVWRVMPCCAGFGKSLSIVRWLFQSIHALQEAVV